MVIKIVANNFFGRSNSLTTNFCVLDLEFEAASRSIRDREKKATSAPEINAEQTNKTSKNTILSIKAPVKIIPLNKNKLEGSGSN